MTTYALWLLVSSFGMIGCATSGPTPEEQRIEIEQRQWESQQHADIDKDAARVQQYLVEIEKLLADNCSALQQTTAPTIDTCTNLMLVRSNFQDRLRDFKRQHQDIEFGRARREQRAQMRAYEEDMNRRKQIGEAFQQAFPPKPRIECKTVQLGNDFRTTCE